MYIELELLEPEFLQSVRDTGRIRGVLEQRSSIVAAIILVNAICIYWDFWCGQHLIKVICFPSIFLTALMSSSLFKKFWKICPMEHLLSRLEVDSRPVSRRIANLLFNSFFPINQPEDVWCERCVTLIQMNSAAARKFYQYAHEYTAPTNIGKVQNLMSLISQHVIPFSFFLF